MTEEAELFASEYAQDAGTEITKEKNIHESENREQDEAFPTEQKIPLSKPRRHVVRGNIISDQNRK